MRVHRSRPAALINAVLPSVVPVVLAASAVLVALSAGGCGGTGCFDRPPVRPVAVPGGVTYVGGDERQRAELSRFVYALRSGDVIAVARRELGVPGVAKADWLVDHYAVAAWRPLRIRIDEYAGDLGEAPVCITFGSGGERLSVGLGSPTLSSAWQMVYPSVPTAGEPPLAPGGASCA